MIRERDDVRDWLTTRLTELEARVARIEAEQQQPLDADSGERAVAREDDDALDAVEHSALLEIAQTRQALKRLADGTYGQCASCGKDISPHRLDAIPAAALCIDCAN